MALLPKELFLCPFTQKPLIKLTNDELKAVNQKIQEEQLHFYQGPLVNIELEEAYSTINKLYIYPVFRNTVLLKKETAIVTKNRIENPYHKKVEQDNEIFYANYGFGIDMEFPQRPNKPMSDELKERMSHRIKKSGNVLLTANSSNPDDVINLLYGTDYNYHFHLDHNFSRLQAFDTEFGTEAVKVLVDKTVIPMKESSVDTCIDFELADYLYPFEQKDLYDAFKFILKPEAALIKLFVSPDDLMLKKLLSVDVASKKTMSFLTPWKKNKVPYMFFIQKEVPDRNLGGNETFLSQDMISQLL